MAADIMGLGMVWEGKPLSMDEAAAFGRDVPLRIHLAARLAYPDGSMAASGLRREAARGRLAIERVAGKDYTTLSAIAEMREKCLLEPKARGYGCARSGDRPTLDAISPQDASRAK